MFNTQWLLFNIFINIWICEEDQHPNVVTDIFCIIVPVITTTLHESVTETSTDTVVFTYDEETQDGVFDFYRFTINGKSAPVQKQRSDTDRKVRFTGLTAGTKYTVEAKTYSGTEFSSVTKYLEVVTGKSWHRLK